MEFSVLVLFHVIDISRIKGIGVQLTYLDTVICCDLELSF
jgi:hypothetical protein